MFATMITPKMAARAIKRLTTRLSNLLSSSSISSWSAFMVILVAAIVGWARADMGLEARCKPSAFMMIRISSASRST